MEFFMNFDKQAISSKVMEFLEINLNQEEDKKSFARLLRGNKLLYKEATAFIETLLRAFTIEDGKEDIPYISNLQVHLCNGRNGKNGTTSVPKFIRC